MSKRWLNVITLLVMLVGLLPTAALAAVPPTPNAATPQAPTQPVVSAPVRPGYNLDLPAVLPSSPTEGKKVEPRELAAAKPLPKTLEGQAVQQADSAVQTKTGPANMPEPIVNFEGVSNLDSVYPPDTDGSVGPNHYVQMVNVHTAVYDKSGTLLYGPFTPNSLWPAGDPCRNTNDGDPITLYDRYHDRWVLSQFGLPNYPNGPYYQCIAISKTPVPTNVPADWWVYSFVVSTTKMNDYPKLALWPDGLYMTANQFTGGDSWGGAGVWAFDYAKMLAGQATTFQFIDLYNANPSFGGMLPVEMEGPDQPPAGTPAFFVEVDDSSWIGPVDALRIWKFHVDWANPANSTFGVGGQPDYTLPVDNFNLLPCTVSGSRGCIPQPGTSVKLDAIGDRLMYRATYRNFGDHSSIVFNHTVLGSGTDVAGLRWYEVRDAETTPVIYQQGTFAPDDGGYRWMASMAMDHVGNMGLGYSISSGSIYPSIRYVGRLTGDPLGTMSQGEANVITGSGAQTGTASRWGDYSAMAIDPVDDCTFWYTQEYIQTTGTTSWQTRIASFKFPSCSLGPMGTLAGTVTRADTSAPIQSASIKVTSGGGQVSSTSTNASGAYSMIIPTGTYAVQVSAYGYRPATFTGVVVTEGRTTTRNAALAAAPSHTVSGKVFDPAAGWPLYAEIRVDGYPGQPFWTDPATGDYSVTLVAGQSYTFHAAPFVPGYTPAAVDSGVLTGDLTFDIPVQADTATCSAPGYVLDETGVGEAFEGASFPPAGWTVVNNGGACEWRGDDPGGRTNLTGGSGKFAIADADNCGEGTVMDTTLTSPVMDVSTLASVNFSYNFDYRNVNPGELADVDVSADGGATWINVHHWNTDQRGPGTFAQDLTPLLGGSTQAQLRFHYIAPGWYWWWEVDNVFVGERNCHPIPGGGMVVGRVADATDDRPLAGATVTSDTGGSATAVATPLDPALGDFYALFQPAGTHVITASKRQYSPASVSVTVPLSDTIRQDFALQTGRLVYTPSSIAESILTGASVTVPVTVTNIGGGAAHFELLEIDKSVVPSGPFEKPDAVTKPFRWDMPTAEEALPPRIGDVPPYAAGDVIQTWTPAGATGPWGIAFDGQDSSVWVSSPAVSWGGDDQLIEYQPDGTATGRAWSYAAIPHSSGPTDAAFNWQTGMIWVMNVNVDANCIYEIDPASGLTGNKICPTGSTGFTTSQRGVAYDPETDTWFAGGWNDQMIYRFQNDGTLLASKNVGIAIAGLAYNPNTQHLFVVDNNAPNRIYVLDVADNYAAIGQFSIAGWVDYSGAGMEFDCDGNLWLVNQKEGKVYQVQSGETASLCGSDVPWLSETPVQATVQPGESVTVDVKLDGAGVAPGIYSAQLKFKHDTPHDVPNIPVTMTVGAVPQCAFTTNSPVLLGDAVTFTNATTGADSYQWNFGDGSPVNSDVNPTHVYTAFGIYDVTLTATNKWGDSQCSRLVSVESKPAPDFISNSPVLLGQLMGFTNVTPAANPPVTAWLWDFDDGATSSYANPTHRYAAGGTYTVTLTAISARGSSSVEHQVTVLAYGVAMAPVVATKTGSPGAVVAYTLRITNTGSTADTITLSNSDNNWMTDVPTSVGPLAPGAGADITVNVTVPADAAGGAADFAVVKAKSAGQPGQSASSVLITKAANSYGLDMTPPSDGKTANPGTTVTYTLHIVNTGNVDDTFALDKTGNGWVTGLPANVGPLAIGGSADIIVRVTIPASAGGGTTDQVVISAHSQANSAVSASSALITTARKLYAVKVAPAEDRKWGRPGIALDYALVITNTGNTDDVFSVTAVSAHGWTANLDQASVALHRGESAAVGVRVTIPVTAADGMLDDCTVTITSTNDSAKSATAVLHSKSVWFRIYLPVVRR
ncbi:MAG: PKD domain-containing protein [Actinomycetes bacterium]